MDEVSVVLPNGNNRSDGVELWAGILDEESALPLDASEGGLFAGNFVPPPPRPLFLDESVTPDGLTTCDLCSWAWQNGNGAFAFDNTREVSGEWMLTLVIVSFVSALIGAIIMITVIHCKRMKSSTTSEVEHGRSPSQRALNSRPPINTPDDKEISTITPANFPSIQNSTNSSNGVWSWLSRKSTTTPSQLNTPPTSPAENHYTHMEDGYNSVGEALYAELDRESSTGDNDRDSNSPAYQNSAYTDPDAQVSSAPSSAYYSDLSVTTVPDRAYEVVGLVTMPCWDPNNGNSDLRRSVAPRLAAISENVSVPSDYV
ncbi:uncharacterized protein LOC108908222 [Anoplophora glabripennis]|uniref:uncharacterized protein LOC108908222 n=1 Tax=Anoplophora glabripennis TaxID=217634 RepID=UPI0008749C49|nr:uncharacterized protein LOC108908222 [Anoplophora glabripennis]